MAKFVEAFLYACDTCGNVTSRDRQATKIRPCGSCGKTTAHLPLAVDFVAKKFFIVEHD